MATATGADGLDAETPFLGQPRRQTIAVRTEGDGHRSTVCIDGEELTDVEQLAFVISADGDAHLTLRRLDRDATYHMVSGALNLFSYAAPTETAFG